MSAQVKGQWDAVSVPSILIVDDEPGLLRLFAGLIDRLDCRPIQACGGAAALEVLAEETPDLMILDLAMPEVSGFDVLRFVRDHARLDNMKVMILTARPNMVPEIEALGIDCWLSKPVMPHDFLDVVRSVLNGDCY
jgi:DNA-binding response OmpR family regulator